MIRRTGIVFILIVLPVLTFAQSARVEVVPPGPNPYLGPSPNLTADQQEGQRLFMQRCSICHVPGTPAGRHLGPRLTKELFAGREDTVRQVIMNGTDRMPGYRYAFKESQMNNVIEYLKTGMEATKVDQSGPAPARK